MSELRMNTKLCLMYGEVMADDVGLKQQAQYMTEVTEYGKHFLALGRAHGFVIYNGLSQWPRSDALMCRNQTEVQAQSII